jgi:hypothetical protein
MAGSQSDWGERSLQRVAIDGRVTQDALSNWRDPSRLGAVSTGRR